MAVIYSALNSYSFQFLSFLTIVILSRLLSPREIGVYAVAAAAIAIATELRSLGVVQYLIREEEIGERKCRDVLGMAILVSWSLGALVISSAQWLANFYDEPDLDVVLWILSSTFFLGPFTSVPMALWRRDMQFQKLFIQTAVGTSISAATAITLVALGWSYYGVATSVVIALIAELVVAIVMQPAGSVWVPRFGWVRGLLTFGIFTSLVNVFARFSESLPDVVLGRVTTMTDVGFFSRGFGAILFLNRLTTQAVGPVVLPHLATVRREGGSVGEAYTRALSLSLAVSWPLMAVASAAAYPMILALFGDQWTTAVPIASVLALWGMLSSIHAFGKSALLVSFSERSMFTIGLTTLMFQVLAVLAAATVSLEAVAWAIVASGALEFVLYTKALAVVIDLPIRRLCDVLVRSAIVAAVCWAVTVAIDLAMDFQSSNPWVAIAAVAFVLPPVWAISIRKLKPDAWTIIHSQLALRIAPSMKT